MWRVSMQLQRQQHMLFSQQLVIASEHTGTYMLLLVWGWEAVGPCGCAAEMFQCFLSVAAKNPPCLCGDMEAVAVGLGDGGA